MRKLIYSFTILTLLTGGVLVLSVLGDRRASAQGSAPVLVTNPTTSPVPVTGHVTFAGQHGHPLPVSVSNSPLSVSVSNSPLAVNLSGSPSVLVGNTAASPALVRDVDVAARTLFQKELSFTTPSGSNQASTTFTFPSNIVVAVIQYLDVHSAVTTGLKPFLSVRTNFAGDTATYRPSVFSQGPTVPTHDFYTGAGPVTIYADPGSVITCRVDISANVTAASGGGCSFSGYYIRTP